MMRKNQILVYFLTFTIAISSFNFAVPAQDSSLNPDKVKSLAEPPAEVQPDEVYFNPVGDELVPSAVLTVSPNAAIPDDGYNGTLDSMTCSTLNTTQVVPAGTVVAALSLNVRMTHSWVGDLTMKLRAPDGRVLTILNRPGSNAADNGSDAPVGDSSNWNGASITFADGAGPEAETMGVSLADAQNICTNDGICAHDPSPDTASTPPVSFADLNDRNARGQWALCVGDSNLLDVGTLNSWSLNLTYAYEFAATVNGAIPDDGYAGGFGGVGQRCSTIAVNTNIGSATVVGAYVDVDLSHSWVGDLTMKLRSPNGTTLTVLNRPGSTAADDGGGAVGNSANWNGVQRFRDGAGPEAETMGNGLTTDQLVCPAGSVCRYDPSPDTATQPPSAFSAFNGSATNGNWTLCVGDSALGDVGTLRSWTLKLVSPSALVPTAASVSVGGRVNSAYGLPVRNAVVTLTDSTGASRSVRSSSFGFFKFNEVTSGAIYTVTVEAKGYSFIPQVVDVADDLRELNFTAQP